MNEPQILFSLLRYAVCGVTDESRLREHFTDGQLPALLQLAAPHDLQHILGYSLQALKLGTDHPQFSAVVHKTREAVFRYARMNLDYESICSALESAGIAHLPLKGSVLRASYPEPWMRTSCDIDLLVHKTDLDAAADVLVNKLHFTRGALGHYDLSMHSPGKVHLELHFSVENPENTNSEQDVLAGFWQAAEPEPGFSFRYRVSDEMFYFYHITHMAKHLQDAECGIRPFLDLWILNHKISHDRKKREALLVKGGMLPFAQAAEALSEVWFSGSTPDPLSQRLEAFILQHGTESYTANYVALKQGRQGGKLHFLLQKIFPPFQRMAWYYPVLRKHPWLLPVCTIRRWCRLIFTRDSRRAVHTMKTNAAVSAGDVASVSDLMAHLGLRNSGTSDA